MRYRKNINCLTIEELHDLREALAGMYALPAGDPNSFAKIAGFHGGPPTAYCRHGAPGFFTWHRAYILAFENALRTIRCNVTLPFWDWSSGPTTGVPEPCRHPTYVNRSGATVANPLYSGPRAAGGQTSRRADINTTSYGDLATTAQTAMSASTFTSFQNQINGVHGSVHGRTGGDMGSVPTASYDPIFYLHHANVDRLWAQWQAAHPGALPASEGTFELQPFNRPFSTQWQRGSDVESTDTLGYRYRRFCFIFPPIRIWELVAIEWPGDIRKQMTSARLLINSTRMQKAPLEIRAFLNHPEADAGTLREGNPAFAGAVGFLGHGEMARPRAEAEHCAECEKLGNTQDHQNHQNHCDDHKEHGHSAPHVSTEKDRFDVEIDITDSVRRLSSEKNQVSLKLAAVDIHGKQMAAGEVLLDEIELVVE